MANNISTFNVNCTDCPRLSKYLKEIRKKYPEYYAKPVSSFGSAHPQLLVVGLAPGLHGANATGRPFTGDHAGILLYQMLYKYGFSNNPISRNANDGLKLKDSRITNAVRCLPPQNKPLGNEIDNCNRYLGEELENIKKEALKYLNIFKDHPYIFNLGHGVMPETDPMKVDYLVKLVKDY